MTAATTDMPAAPQPSADEQKEVVLQLRDDIYRYHGVRSTSVGLMGASGMFGILAAYNEVMPRDEKIEGPVSHYETAGYVATSGVCLAFGYVLGMKAARMLAGTLARQLVHLRRLTGNTPE